MRILKTAFNVHQRKHPWGAEGAEKNREHAENSDGESRASLCELCVSAFSALKELVSEYSEAAFTVKRYLFLAAFLSIFGAAVTQPVVAKDAAPLAQDPATEKRLVDISSELRCLVCQNESLSASNAELANDLRREIRTLIKDGKSDSEIMDFMVSRYGDFVRYRPPLKASTLLLWFGPALLFAGGLAALVFTLRRRNRAIRDSPLSAEEQRQADDLLNVKEPRQ
jgi:cytochrome c-type biogenesis protein CcmH